MVLASTPTLVPVLSPVPAPLLPLAQLLNPHTAMNENRTQKNLKMTEIQMRSLNKSTMFVQVSLKMLYSMTTC